MPGITLWPNLPFTNTEILGSVLEPGTIEGKYRESPEKVVFENRTSRLSPRQRMTIWGFVGAVAVLVLLI